MIAVVTGGTGFIGRPLVRRLLADGWEVRVLTRDPGRAALWLPVRAETHPWNGKQPPNSTALRGAHVVFHLAGEGIADGRWTAARKRAIQDSRVLSTRALVQGLRTLVASERPKVFVGASAIGFYGERGNEELDEESAGGKGYLADTCQAWEAEARDLERMQVRSVLVRIGVVLGRDGGALSRMVPPFRLGLGGRLGSGRQWMSWIHLADVIDLFVASARQEGFRGVVNGVAPSPLRNSDFTRELGRALRRPAVLPAPEFALRLALGEMATLLLGSQRVASTARAKLGLDYRFPELRFALDDLLSDFAHEVECEQWLPRSPEEVFPFFSEPFNLERITPDFLGFQVVGISTDKLQEGTRIEYKLRIRGIPVRWQSAIERWSPNRCFVDRQIKGPYKSWHHTHEFEAHAGGTVVRDRIRYEVPLGAVGALMGDRWVARDVARIFEYRRERLRAIFG